MMSDEAKAVVRRYFEEFHSGRAKEILPDIVADELLEPTRTATERLEAAFPDYRLTIDTLVAEGDTVAAVWTGEGTHEGEWQSPSGAIAPTGRHITWTGTTTLRLIEGRISDVLGSHWDHLGILQQLGAIGTEQSRPGA